MVVTGRRPPVTSQGPRWSSIHDDALACTVHARPGDAGVVRRARARVGSGCTPAIEESRTGRFLLSRSAPQIATVHRRGSGADCDLGNLHGHPIWSLADSVGRCGLGGDGLDERPLAGRTTSAETQHQVGCDRGGDVGPSGVQHVPPRVASRARGRRTRDCGAHVGETRSSSVRCNGHHRPGYRCCHRQGHRRLSHNQAPEPGPERDRAHDRRAVMVLVTGATGNVGREVVGLLLAEGRQVVAVSRNPAAAPRFPSGARVIAGNPSRPQTLANAFQGIEAVLLSPRALAGAAKEFVELAVSNGVRRAVVLSALTVQYGGGLRRFADEFRAFEDIVKGSSLAWTLLRSADYASDASAWI